MQYVGILIDTERNAAEICLFSEGFRFTHLGWSDREIYPYIAFITQIGGSTTSKSNIIISY